MGPVMQYATEKLDAPYEVRIYPRANARFTLYEDDNETYNYEKGQYATYELSWNDTARVLTVGKRKGNFPGMTEKRMLRVVLAGPSAKRRDHRGIGKCEDCYLQRSEDGGSVRDAVITRSSLHREASTESVGITARHLCSYASFHEWVGSRFLPLLFGWQYGDLRRAGRTFCSKSLQDREAKESCIDRSEWNFLENGVVFDVSKTARVNIRRPVLSIHAGFESVSLNHAILNFVLARKIGEADNPLRTPHINGELARHCQICIHDICMQTSPPDRGRISVNRIRCRTVALTGFLTVHAHDLPTYRC